MLTGATRCYLMAGPDASRCRYQARSLFGLEFLVSVFHGPCPSCRLVQLNFAATAAPAPLPIVVIAIGILSRPTERKTAQGTTKYQPRREQTEDDPPPPPVIPRTRFASIPLLSHTGMYYTPLTDHRSLVHHLDIWLGQIDFWSVHMICMHDLYTWSVCMICTHDLYAWSVCMICTHDLSTWSVCMICTHDLYTWSVHMICTYDLYTWSVHMICMICIICMICMI